MQVDTCVNMKFKPRFAIKFGTADYIISHSSMRTHELQGYQCDKVLRHITSNIKKMTTK